MNNSHGDEPAHAPWLRSVQHEISEDYKRLHVRALDDPQRAGHGSEQTWARFLEDWLPPSYRVVTRRFIVPEIGTSEAFETDLVVLRPSYPSRLARREEILSGGVAAAFSVRLTLDAAGIRDGLERAVKLRKSLKRRVGTTVDEMVPPFCVGILAHSHTWKKAASRPLENVTRTLRLLDNNLVEHPRECLDFLCVADLGLWWTTRIPLVREAVRDEGNTEEVIFKEFAMTGIGHTGPGEIFGPVASFITHVLAKLSYSDPALGELVGNLRNMGTLGESNGNGREWPLGDVFSNISQAQLPYELLSPKGPGIWGTPMF